MPKLIGFALMLGFLALSHPATAYEPTPAERAACQQDAFKLCTHAMPMRDNVRACLRKNMPRLQSLCQGALRKSKK